MELYRIRDWNKHFENNRTRAMNNLRWVPFPNKHDGDGYSELVAGHAHGPSHFAAWCVLVQVASKCEPRGTLIRDGGQEYSRPHDSASLSRKTKMPAKLFEEALPRLVEVGWIERIPFAGNDLEQERHPSVTRASPERQSSAAEGKGREGKGIEGNGREKAICSETGEPSSEPKSLTLLVFPCDGQTKTWELSRSQVEAWQKLYPSLDVYAECRAAYGWIDSNPQSRKTSRGMKRFLNGWLSRSQDKGGRQTTQKLPPISDLPFPGKAKQ